MWKDQLLLNFVSKHNLKYVICSSTLLKAHKIPKYYPPKFSSDWKEWEWAKLYLVALSTHTSLPCLRRLWCLRDEEIIICAPKWQQLEDFVQMIREYFLSNGSALSPSSPGDIKINPLRGSNAEAMAFCDSMATKSAHKQGGMHPPILELSLLDSPVLFIVPSTFTPLFNQQPTWKNWTFVIQGHESQANWGTTCKLTKAGVFWVSYLPMVGMETTRVWLRFWAPLRFPIVHGSEEKLLAFQETFLSVHIHTQVHLPWQLLPIFSIACCAAKKKIVCELNM